MAEKRNHPPQPPPAANYRSALARAVEWLGINSAHRLGVDRYHR